MIIKEFYKTSDVPLDFTGVCSIYGGTYHYKNGLIHNENDPAIIDSFGNKLWCFNGQFHRINNPAIEYASGRKEWYIDGKRYSEEKSFKNFFKSFDYINDVPEDFTGIAKIQGCIYYYENGEHHRENGHAVEYKDGTKVWYLKGKRHRENGPAVEYASGTKEWFVNNEWHRENGPAIEYADGTKFWYKNNKHHREDGPATEYPNGYKEWWVNGQLHRLDGPAVENCGKGWWIDGKEYLEKDFIKKVADMNVIKFQRLYNVPKDFTGHCVITSVNANCYYENGMLHREDGPAYEINNGHKEWHLNGKLHREDGPAKEYPGSKYWYQNGKLHREGGHAFEDFETKTWWINGNRHRLDGPAIECADGTKEWWIDGENYSEEEFTKKVANMNIKKFSRIYDVPKDFTGVCMITSYNKTCYYKDGELHREDGPAVEYTSGTKEWYIKGKNHRTDGPAVENANGDKQWWVNGKLHREDSPAIEYADGSKYWYLNGQHHRIDGPASELANGDKEWWRNNQLHRIDGPAIEYVNGDKHWWVEGKKYLEEEFNAKIHGVKKFKNYNQVPKDFTGMCDINSTIHYYKEGEFHREDGPALIYKSGDKEWCINGKLHREDGPAVEGVHGDKYWFINGERHREDGPAVEYPDGSKEWWVKGKCHREDGPAIESCNGDKAWYLHGKEYTKENFDIILNKDSNSVDINESVDKIQVVENTTQEKSKYDLMIKICNKASYRILSEQIVLCIIKSIKHGLSKISSLRVAEEIITSSVGKALVQAGIGIVLNKFDYNNEHIDKISEEMIISSISTLENSIFDSLIASIDVKEMQNQDTFIRISEKTNEQEFEIEFNNNQQSLSI